MSAIERNRAEFETFLTGLAHGCVDFDQLAGWHFDQKSELAVLRAENRNLRDEKACIIQNDYERIAAQAKQIGKLRSALDMLAVQVVRDIAPGWISIPETEWTGTMMLLDHDGLAPSTVAVVSLERLRELASRYHHDYDDGWYECPVCGCHGGHMNPKHEDDCWLAAAIRAAEGET